MSSYWYRKCPQGPFDMYIMLIIAYLNPHPHLLRFVTMNYSLLTPFRYVIISVKMNRALNLNVAKFVHIIRAIQVHEHGIAIVMEYLHGILKKHTTCFD